MVITDRYHMNVSPLDQVWLIIRWLWSQSFSPYLAHRLTAVSTLWGWVLCALLIYFHHLGFHGSWIVMAASKSVVCWIIWGKLYPIYARKSTLHSIRGLFRSMIKETRSYVICFFLKFALKNSFSDNSSAFNRLDINDESENFSMIMKEVVPWK